MGIYFNPDSDGFKKDVNSQIYVDKTGLIVELNKMINTTRNCVAISHARRFGKSHAAGMIDSFYSVGADNTALFSNLYVGTADNYKKHLNAYNVIHLDISSFVDSYEENLIEKIKECLILEFQEEFGDRLNLSGKFESVLYRIAKLSDRPFVIIIDEWDCVIRNMADKPKLVHKYLQFLHSLFKSDEAKTFLALGYITGILPIKKIENESALNNFNEYTMISSGNMTEYFGFTENEVRSLCDKFEMDFSLIQQWYNGYLIDGKHMYNPNSVYMALCSHKLDSYWRNTSAFSSINRYIQMNFEGLKDAIISLVSGERVSVTVDTFQNDLSEIGSKNEAITALIHLGYLGYDADAKEAFLPNYEVKTAFQLALEKGEWKEVAKSISRCDELLKATIACDSAKVEQIIELAHSAYTSVLKYNDENSLSCVLTMAYFTAPAYYTVIRELPTGVGFADIALVPKVATLDKPAMIIELKYNQSSDSAIEQIKDRRYAGTLDKYKDNLLLVGISYNKEDVNKKHHCVIERYQL